MTSNTNDAESEQLRFLEKLFHALPPSQRPPIEPTWGTDSNCRSCIPCRCQSVSEPDYVPDTDDVLAQAKAAGVIISPYIKMYCRHGILTSYRRWKHDDLLPGGLNKDGKKRSSFTNLLRSSTLPDLQSIRTQRLAVEASDSLLWRMPVVVPDPFLKHVLETTGRGENNTTGLLYRLALWGGALVTTGALLVNEVTSIIGVLTASITACHPPGYQPGPDASNQLPQATLDFLNQRVLGAGASNSSSLSASLVFGGGGNVSFHGADASAAMTALLAASHAGPSLAWCEAQSVATCAANGMSYRIPIDPWAAVLLTFGLLILVRRAASYQTYVKRQQHRAVRLAAFHVYYGHQIRKYVPVLVIFIMLSVTYLVNKYYTTAEIDKARTGNAFVSGCGGERVYVVLQDSASGYASAALTVACAVVLGVKSLLDPLQKAAGGNDDLLQQITVKSIIQCGEPCAYHSVLTGSHIYGNTKLTSLWWRINVLRDWPGKKQVSSEQLHSQRFTTAAPHVLTAREPGEAQRPEASQGQVFIGKVISSLTPRWVGIGASKGALTADGTAPSAQPASATSFDGINATSSSSHLLDSPAPIGREQALSATSASVALGPATPQRPSMRPSQSESSNSPRRPPPSSSRVSSHSGAAATSSSRSPSATAGVNTSIDISASVQFNPLNPLFEGAPSTSTSSSALPLASSSSSSAAALESTSNLPHAQQPTGATLKPHRSLSTRQHSRYVLDPSSFVRIEMEELIQAARDFIVGLKILGRHRHARFCCPWPLIYFRRAYPDHCICHQAWGHDKSNLMQPEYLTDYQLGLLLGHIAWVSAYKQSGVQE